MRMAALQGNFNLQTPAGFNSQTPGSQSTQPFQGDRRGLQYPGPGGPPGGGDRDRNEPRRHRDHRDRDNSSDSSIAEVSPPEGNAEDEYEDERFRNRVHQLPYGQQQNLVQMVAGVPVKIVPFRRGGSLLIEAWVYNVESYFQLNHVPRTFWVKATIGFFHQQHFDELRHYRKLPYREFKKTIITLFKRPDLTHAKITELFQAQQGADESGEVFMDRLSAMAQLGFKHLPDDEKQGVLVTAFCKGLRDRDIARLVATQARGRVAGAIRVASAALSFNQGEKPPHHSNPTQTR